MKTFLRTALPGTLMFVPFLDADAEIVGNKDPGQNNFFRSTCLSLLPERGLESMKWKINFGQGPKWTGHGIGTLKEYNDPWRRRECGKGCCVLVFGDWFKNPCDYDVGVGPSVFIFPDEAIAVA